MGSCCSIAEAKTNKTQSVNEAGDVEYPIISLIFRGSLAAKHKRRYIIGHSLVACVILPRSSVHRGGPLRFLLSTPPAGPPCPATRPPSCCPAPPRPAAVWPRSTVVINPRLPYIYKKELQILILDVWLLLVLLMLVLLVLLLLVLLLLGLLLLVVVRRLFLFYNRRPPCRPLSPDQPPLCMVARPP